jgi:hypothetical protein
LPNSFKVSDHHSILIEHGQMSDGEDEPFSFWTPEVLSGLYFQNNRALLDHLRIEALKYGFDIATRQALVIPYGSFHCTKG